MSALTRDAEVIHGRLPREPLPAVTWYPGREERALTVRLGGVEQPALAVERYVYPDRVAYRIRAATRDSDRHTIRVWWDDAAMRWGWLPAGVDAREAHPWEGGGEVRRRRWADGESLPELWVHAEGAWREAVLREREDRPDGTVVYEVGLHGPGALSPDDRHSRRIFYDPRSVQRRHPGGERDGRV
ncbi:hypothetical protein V2S66_20900 [Streptomyces sp. V4-01]|uniref:Uncharacterized protein n=1 Tax=Actinacidiphila polyblastidii TaxID=3110430 RepID=A0ABU7PF26_9ACTN|nr:hypothetical protein [Streptomyces sp. V4-01]